ncbi:AMP-binding enzyme family protein [Mycobacterium kansasii]|uniref:AMP-binding enzyme family protein n=1 Tax=Mycobacterium kansasii TaxID=1768 RepID=A0A1V3WTN3_MYCKA|nr:AMP-binding enzyme family protein [Mycobacterium kansasii]
MFVGRADRQVKVRGFRIEPAEVERQLAAHPAIRQVRVCTRRHPDGRHELLAYLVLAANLTFDAYHRHLADTVAPYMRPQHTYVVDALPHTANGKVDEAALLNCAVAPWRRPGPSSATPVPPCASYSSWRAASLAWRISPRATDSSPAAAIP